jgi:hypothetical protein
MKKEGVMIFLLLFVLVGVGVIIIQNKFKNSLSNKLEDMTSLNNSTNQQETIINETQIIDCSDIQKSECNSTRIEQCLPTKYKVVQTSGQEIEIILFGFKEETCKTNIGINSLSMNCYIPKAALSMNFFNEIFSTKESTENALILYC